MSVARRASSTARRSLLTATAAGTLLGALWFVPSANATQEQTPIRDRATTATTTSADTRELADTGSPNTTPYIIGGTTMLALGAAFVAYSIRREHEDLGPVGGA
ncbi:MULTISPECIES: LPXTG cell wall anchor domain-containing protein [Streptomyces]|uniref:LPXTG cell wall anchor domain-containing protein n=1 Tax=Streptomyces caniscabiei TaxID=2746961 RepID=A0ABU4MJ82_9ACTN|nr:MULTISPECIES: LPXTG cell wall anchor domain-containing protein [Streptomyces]MDX2601149.1 LPXTG cell wall anchor domain-containing protein [Streptomyces caniscabiei]MDX2739035.1 LPXTG cell wall anchor domain-containing protein [Streptomyces caniscabiei]MDX2778495.1 LPXTG cell wall anchor domain-containing protein [Streptomyces caniscabiei]MDX2947772.1 LPXTG cell wall anchor domain-containing protein [Streptomyces caniscabiei]MDX2957065.1 LPXTG cell wall anchor domain-containing protein [Str